MKSPADLKDVLRRQWEKGAVRQERLLGGPAAWPVILPIGRPSPRMVSTSLDVLKRHVEAWRSVRIGQVLWEPVRYRQASSPVEIPTAWQLNKPSDWIEAAGDASMKREFHELAHVIEQTAAEFHPFLIRRHSLWADTPREEVVRAARIALKLEPGCAAGRPLRRIAYEGIDTKFFERHAKLITALLDVRFDGEVGRIGLEDFLGALRDGDHWLLVIDLDGSLLPFRKLRVRSSELKASPLPGERLLIIENEACQHHLPDAPGTIAVLGSGFDLNWTEGAWLASKQVAFWGDIDTWGLQFLATARNAIPHLVPLFTNEATFDEFTDLAVPEPVAAASDPPTGLSDSESRLYRRLLDLPRGRLEQEFLPADRVRQAILDWLGTLA